MAASTVHAPRMIRVVVYLVVVGLLAFGAVWLADRPGDVAITWLGRRIETSVMVLDGRGRGGRRAGGDAVVDRARGPALARRARALSAHPPRRARLSRGVAGAGRGRLRRCRAPRANSPTRPRRIAPDEPLTLLLRAQTAQLAGDREAAAAHLPADGGPRRHQAARPARAVHRGAAAQRPRRRAALCRGGGEARAPVPAWAGQAVLEFRCVAGDWSGALDAARAQHARAASSTSAAYRRQRAVLLTAQALARRGRADGRSTATAPRRWRSRR